MMNILKSKGRYIIYVGLMAMLLSTSVAFGLDYKAVVIVPETIMRQEKAFDSKQLDKLNIGTGVTIKEVSDGWYRVGVSDTQSEGWISSDEVVIYDDLFMENSLKKGDVTASVLNVRLGPSTDNTRITQICRGDTVTIINTSDTPEKWYEVILSNNIKGWVHSDYIKITYNFPKGNVNTDSIILKQEPSDDAAHIVQLKKDEIVYIKGYVEGCYNVITSADIEGWVESKYITVLRIDAANVNRAGYSREVFNDIDTITAKYLGKRYSYGGNGPNSFDCSGFTSYILKTYYGEYLKLKGINLPRTASSQATLGTPVSRANLQKGDLVFFDTAGRIGDNIGHVGIYIGDGKIIHASSSRARIVIDNLSDSYYAARFMKAVRL
ncbi:MAG TPA: SH3 domain-containing C40 family peptidase [Clostridia bacterium]|nr:SH3 domain-containing C40 family peptidase [Clostridia bacterium]